MDRKRDNWKTAFFWGLGILLFFLIISVWSNIATTKNYQDNYRWDSCEEGDSIICIGDDEDYQICDTDRFERAICVSENYDRWITCYEGRLAICVDKE